jgi:hypothetical protein
VDDPCPARHGGQRRLDRAPPQRVDDVRRAVAARRLGHPLGELTAVVGVERDGRVGAGLPRAAQPVRVAPGAHDALGTEQPGRLDGDQADGAGGAEHEHAIVGAHGGAPSQRQPTRQAGDAEGGSEAGVCVPWQLDDRSRRRRCALGQAAVAGDAEAAPRHVDERPVGEAVRTCHAPDRLGAGDIRQRGMTGEEAPAADGDVDRVQRRGEHVDDRLVPARAGLVHVGCARGVAQLGDQRGSHGARLPTCARTADGRPGGSPERPSAL